ncbi:MAG: 7-cyano-7-deazaguanine synthase, partial [Duncaniella sp.]|nr:7-cyano-7-deazaguanine synthase [Duncaniella sp.]
MTSTASWYRPVCSTPCAQLSHKSIVKSVTTSYEVEKYLLVLSGGMDSVTMLYDYRDSIAAAVTFQYGSNHNMREARCARINCERLGIEWIEIDLTFMAKHFESSLLQGADA